MTPNPDPEPKFSVIVYLLVAWFAVLVAAFIAAIEYCVNGGAR